MKNNRTSRQRGPLPGARGLSASRAAILDHLIGQPEPVALAALVSATGLHYNTVREHVTGLVRRGLARRIRMESTGRGRPAWLYEATDDTVNEYATLAAALAYAIAESAPDPQAVAKTAGEHWGRQLAVDQGDNVSTAVQARQVVVEVLEELGFEPRLRTSAPDDLLLTHCPLLEAAYREQQVVCAVHLGIVQGALRHLGADPGGTELHPFSDPGGCRLLVPPRTPHPAAPSETH